MKMTPTQEAIPYRPEVDNFDVAAALRRFRRAVFGNFHLIVLSCVLTIGLVLLYWKLFPPVFQAEVVVLAEGDNDPDSQYYAMWNLFRKTDLKSEPALMTSRYVVRRVVEDLDLTFDDVYHPPLVHLAYLWKQSWLGQRYGELKEWLFPPEESALKPTPEQIDRARTVEAFRKGVMLEVVPDTTVGQLIVKAPTYRVAEYANRMIDVYLDERRKAATEEAETAYASLKAEVDRAYAELRRVEQDQLAFQQENALALEFEKEKILMAKWVELRTVVHDLEAAIASREANLQIVNEQLEKEPEEIIRGRTFQNSQLRDTIETRVFELSNQLRQAREHYVAGAPEIEEIERLLAANEAALAKEPEKGELTRSGVANPVFETLRQRQQDLTAELAASRANLQLQRAALDDLTKRIEGLPALFKTSQDFSRKIHGLEEQYSLLRERLMMADVSRATAKSAPASIRVVEYAQPPEKQSWPNMKLLLAAALVLGTIAGIGLALLVELFNVRVTRDRLTGRSDLPVYADVQLPGARGALPAPANDSAVGRLRGATE